MANRLFRLSDQQWQTIEPCLESMSTGKPFAQTLSDRVVMEAIIHRHKAGLPWRDLPSDCGPWHLVYQRWRRWVETGKIALILEVAKESAGWEGSLAFLDSTVICAHPCAAGGEGLVGNSQNQALGRSRGGFGTKIHAVTGSENLPLHLALSAGQAADCRQGLPLVQKVGEDKQIKALACDRSYDTNEIRAKLADSKKEAVIPSKKNRKEPIPHDEDQYRERNKAERWNSKIKWFRAVATRYEKLAVAFLSVVQLASALVLLKN